MNATCQFVAPLQVMPQADGCKWDLTRTLRYRDRQGVEHVTPRGFTTDFASIPPLSTIAGFVLLLSIPVLAAGCWQHGVWWVASAATVTAFAVFVVLIAYSLNCDDRLDAAAAQHDYGYRVLRDKGRYELRMIGLGITITLTGKLAADCLFIEAMKASGVSRAKRWVVFLSVLLFGWHAWWDDERIATL